MTPARERLAGIVGPDFIAALDGFIAEQVRGALEAESTGAENDNGRRWVTVAEAAELASCSPDAIRMRARRGRLESRHVGRRVYIARDSFDPPRATA